MSAKTFLLASLLGVSAPDPSPTPHVNWDRPQRLIAVDHGRHIHIRCLGSGSPTIILTAGLGESGENWRTVVPQIARKTRVCAWDRAGMGFSDAATVPQDAAHTTDDLEKALAAGGIKPPYVMVGHSIGSFETLLFTYRHRPDVAGMVLVDPSSPNQNRTFSKASPKFGESTRERRAARSAALRRCIASIQSRQSNLADCGPPTPGLTDARQLALMQSVISLSDEMDGRSSAALIAARKPLGRLPLIVLTADSGFVLSGALAAEQAKVRSAWFRMHDELAAQSTIGVNRIVPNVGHYIHREKPRAVIDAVNEVVSESRKARR